MNESDDSKADSEDNLPPYLVALRMHAPPVLSSEAEERIAEEEAKALVDAAISKEARKQKLQDIQRQVRKKEEIKYLGEDANIQSIIDIVSKLKILYKVEEEAPAAAASEVNCTSNDLI